MEQKFSFSINNTVVVLMGCTDAYFEAFPWASLYLAFIWAR